MSAPLQVPGYDVLELFGSGRCGEVWRAVEQASGDAVALKRLRPDADPVAVAALRRQVPVLQGLKTPYVVRLRGVMGDGARTVLVLDLASGGSLAELLTRRERLEPSEVVTLASPLAHALAAAHAEGVVHGDVRPSNVLFTGDGMPLLADLGLAGCAGDRGVGRYVAAEMAGGASPSAASDVWALGAVVREALMGCAPDEDRLFAPHAPRRLVEAIERALSPDPAARPSAGELAALLRRAHAAAPIRLLGGDTVGVPPQPAQVVRTVTLPLLEPVVRRRLSPRLLVAAAATGLLLLAGGVGWFWGQLGDGPAAAVLAAAAPSSPSSPAEQELSAVEPAGPASLARPATPARPDWASELDRLDALRSRAFAMGDAAVLAQVYVAGSRALSADIAALRELVEAGERAVGVRHTFREVTAISTGATSVELRVIDTLAAYHVTDAQGHVLRRRDGREAAPFHVTLARTATGWHLADVSRR